MYYCTAVAGRLEMERKVGGQANVNRVRTIIQCNAMQVSVLQANLGGSGFGKKERILG
jgi:hypothetical protein